MWAYAVGLRGLIMDQRITRITRIINMQREVLRQPYPLDVVNSGKGVVRIFEPARLQDGSLKK
jgi:hypothetical protein